MKPNHDEIGIGATKDLSLRVSIATLVRVLIVNLKDGDLMLALERKATLLESGQIDVKAQPFGGAIQIRDLRALQRITGDFQFDSEQSRSEQDFRIFIRISDWEIVQQFCLEHFKKADNAVLESDPRRELAEELADVLKINLRADQYTYKPLGTIIENDPSPTENFYARNHPTVRIYRLFEAHILETSLMQIMLTNSSRYSDQDLRELAIKDSRNGGRGWANAVLTLPIKDISSFYSSIAPETRNTPVYFQDHQLDETVAAILDDVTVPKYQRLLS